MSRYETQQDAMAPESSIAASYTVKHRPSNNTNRDRKFTSADCELIKQALIRANS
jgi:hypothetical protein